MTPIPVILNPTARSARAGDRLDAIKHLSPRVEVHETTGPGSARRKAARLASAGAPVIVAAGGDGTINEVVNGIADAGPDCRTAVGMLPSGTMNVFARELALPADRLDECWALIERGNVREVDLWMAGETAFCQLAGAGLDASIIAGTTWEQKRTLGPLSYILSGLRVLAGKAPALTVTVPGRDPITGTAVLMGNGRLYGGPIPLFPDAHLDDGLLDIVILHAHGPVDLMALGGSILTGKYGGKSATYLQAAELEISSEREVPVEVDGDLAGTTPLKVRHAGHRLRVIC